jgi:hypothetical protein
MKKEAIFITIIILCIILLSIPTRCVKEGFHPHLQVYKRYCSSCGTKSRANCSSCTNCGYCITSDGRGECTPGDSQGPYFREDCAVWRYGELYYNPPNTTIYPINTAWRKYPRYPRRYPKYFRFNRYGWNY